MQLCNTKCNTNFSIILNNNLTATDSTKFRFATDGEGNYGYLKADDSFVPFKSENIAFCCTYYAANSGANTKYSVQYISSQHTDYYDYDSTSRNIIIKKKWKYKVEFVGVASHNNPGHKVGFYLNDELIMSYDTSISLNVEIDVTKDNSIFYIKNDAYEAIYGPLLITKL